MVQVPDATRNAIVPDTVHTLEVEDAKVTDRPELAVALRVTLEPAVWAAIAPKLIVWVLKATVKLCDTGAAAA